MDSVPELIQEREEIKKAILSADAFMDVYGCEEWVKKLVNLAEARLNFLNKSISHD